jgi:hypothetical protein
MKTIKAFYKDEKGYYCQPGFDKFYYEEGKTYKMNKKLVKMGESGFHASADFDISSTVISYNVSRAHYGIVDLNIIHADIWIAVGDAITILEFLPRDFTILSKYDKTGEWVYFVGRDWEKFDYNLGLKKLLEIDRTGEWIDLAQKNWKIFKQQKEK